MLGFVLGGIFVYTMQRYFVPAVPPAAALAPTEQTLPPAVAAPVPAETPPQRLPLLALEEIFETYQHHALWDVDTTQVALYNPVTHSLSEYLEVLREGDKFYYRTIPRLTRPIVDRGLDPRSRVQFTEPSGPREEPRAKAETPPVVMAPKQLSPPSPAADPLTEPAKPMAVPLDSSPPPFPK